MDFQRLLLTKDCELFRFSAGLESIAYLLFIPNDNHILVQCAILRELTTLEREEILSFAEKLLSSKPSIDYMVDFFHAEADLESDYPEGDGVFDLVNKTNELFKSNIVIKDTSSINNLIQK
ncbi:hypothetical protein HCJ70_02835 [Listeria booriae]|uniref:hypothetical protein n=1 Tax=Listeria booriae TaxID=1552123 RepID=UPI00162AD498|nr:hypothetical protein [Listeria booriae]MBC1911461.1 hypothetical protein [Listeria booriae]MBC2097969.1 hypothetical protein [Listeria booriae]